MATEYIKREDALNAIRKSPISNMSTRLFCVDAIADIPAADVVERKHGRWVEIEEEVVPCSNHWVSKYFCSECNNAVYALSPYCPNCGAKMESEDN